MLNWSPSRLNSFSFARRVLRSFSQTSRDTTLGYSVLLVLIVWMVFLFSVNYTTNQPRFSGHRLPPLFLSDQIGRSRFGLWRRKRSFGYTVLQLAGPRYD